VSINRLSVMVVIAALATTGVARGQAPPPQPAAGSVVQKGTRPVIPLDVQVVIARYQGDKRVSSVPYLLAVNANSSGVAQLNIGSEVPVQSTTFQPVGDNKISQPLRSYNYKQVGTSISSSAQSTEDGRFELEMSIDESSLGVNAFDTQGAPATELPVFRSFKARNKLLLRDGQSRQFTAATDRISGETIRIEVTLTVVK
jgi:type II secretory pathway component GspD/PulD (secretin)